MYARDPEKVRAYKARTRARTNELERARYAKNPEHFRAKRQRFYQEHTAECLAQSREYAHKHLAETNARLKNRYAQDEAYAATKRERAKRYRLEHLEEIRAKKKAYRLAHAAQLKAKKHAEYLGKAAQISQRASAWKKANPLKAQANHIRRRASKKQAPINDLTAAQWREILAAFDHRCAYCQRKMQRLTQDHISPLGPTGPHTLHNIVPACQSCNSRKYTGPPLIPVQPLLLTLAPAKGK